MRRTALAFVAIALPLAGSVLAGPASAGPAYAATPRTAPAGTPAEDPDAAKQRVDAGIDALRSNLSETDAEYARAVVELRSAQAGLEAATQDLTVAQQRSAQAESAHAQAVQDRDIAQANAAKAEDELERTRAEITQGRARVATFAAQVWIEQGNGAMGLEVAVRNPTEVADRLTLAGTVMDLQAASLDRLANARASQIAQEDHLSAVLGDQKRAERAAAEAAETQARAQEDAAAALVVHEQRTAAVAATLDAVQSRRADEERRLAEMQAESQRLAEVIRVRAEQARASAGGIGPGVSSGSGAGALGWPLPGGWVSSEFGWRVHPITSARTLHAGRDLAAPCGTPVRAAAAGVVVSAGAAGGYGNRVVLDHGIRRGVPLTTVYAHLASIAVSGGEVAQGQVIGYEGTTGFSTGCHLHFETWVWGAPADPRGWL